MNIMNTATVRFSLTTIVHAASVCEECAWCGAMVEGDRQRFSAAIVYG